MQEVWSTIFPLPWRIPIPSDLQQSVGLATRHLSKCLMGRTLWCLVLSEIWRERRMRVFGGKHLMVAELVKRTQGVMESKEVGDSKFADSALIRSLWYKV
ncbi:unnamed protein product [Linum trigynum]|uniref:Uncharacterized protein n=1 Tax=Linum trigynum TaxID=586398 RepID=A0AAV2CFJ3_9ROSI